MKPFYSIMAATAVFMAIGVKLSGNFETSIWLLGYACYLKICAVGEG